jgi:1A family penicillin-binding protein
MFSRTARRRFKLLLLWVEILFILVMGAGVGVVAGAFYQMSKLLPPDADIQHYAPVAGTKFYSSDGVLLGSFAQENREPVEIRKIPKRMQDAIIAIEDSRFYEHSGIDFRGLARALWQNVRSGDLTRQGGSTITQELARQIYLSPIKKFSRKLKETMLAIQIERNWPKKKILETYLNQVYFGSRAYGVQAAAQTYFGKNVGQLNLTQCALLAGLPQRPSKLDPYEYPAAAKARRNLVLQRMADLGMIKPAEADAAMRQKIRLAHKRAPAGTGFHNAPYFCNAVLEQLREKYGDDLLYKGGFKVYTTLNWKMQRLAEQAVHDGLERDGARFNAHDAALVCLDPNTGAVRAMVGGRDFSKNQYNVVTQGRRQPGSSFKAFVYTAAIDSEGWSPYQSIDAANHTIQVGDKWYTPHNDDDDRYGYVTMVHAFAKSINTAAVNTIEKIGPRTVVDYAKRFGIKSRLYAYPTLALGTSEVSPLEMANAYGVYAANGLRAEPFMVKLIKDRLGNVIEENSAVLYHVDVKPETIQAMDELFQEVVLHGTAAGSGAASVPTAHGKTGTTTSHRDAWFIGFTLQPALVTAVWSGNLDNTPMRHAFGGTLCAPIWAHFMADAVKIAPKTKLESNGHMADGTLVARERDERGDSVAAQTARAKRRRGGDTGADQPAPQTMAAAQAAPGDANSGNMVRVRVCMESMELATPNCPSVRMLEYVSGLEPKRLCSLHGGHTRHRLRRRRHPRQPADQPAPATAAPGDNSATGVTPAVATPADANATPTPAPASTPQ